MRAWASLILPVVLFAVLSLLLAYGSMAEKWIDYTFFSVMPYALSCIGVILGLFFMQSRISFFCMMTAVVAFLAQDAFFVDPHAARGSTVIFLSTIYVPSFAVLFYHLGERGIFTAHGFARALIILSALTAITVLPGIDSFSSTVFSSDSVMLRPLSDLLPVPVTGVIILFVCIPLFFVRNRHESPCMGPSFALAVLFVFAGLSFRSSWWISGQEQAVLISFMTGGVMTLVWAVMESLWRNANIDELTDLPGRRPLKHHLARLRSRYILAMVDIDHFKKVNDRHGHDTGDQVLRFVASSLKQCSVGPVYRYGGEEFVIVMENVDLDLAVNFLKELRKMIHRKKFQARSPFRSRKKSKKPKGGILSAPFRSLMGLSEIMGGGKKKTIKLSVSIGVAEVGKKYASPFEVLAAADQALYRAKDDGRNRLRVAR